jgi:hypothetical protein
VSWNYRVVEHRYKEKDGSDASYFSIHEVYYREDLSVNGRTLNPAVPSGETLEELQGTMEKMMTALSKPVLTEAVAATVAPRKRRTTK